MNATDEPILIIGSFISPYVRKVLACLNLKGLDYTIDPITPFFGNDEFARLSPLRRIPVLVALTKAEKVPQRDREARKKEWRELAQPAFPPVVFSGKTGLGREALCRVFAEAALTPGAPAAP